MRCTSLAALLATALLLLVGSIATIIQESPIAGASPPPTDPPGQARPGPLPD